MPKFWNNREMQKAQDQILAKDLCVDPHIQALYDEQICYKD